MSPVTLEAIQSAQARIRPHVYRSPCPYSRALSNLLGANVFCKLDNLQITGSFKERGACNRLMQIPESDRKRGVIAASAGNHALALAYHGTRLGMPVHVVMPKFAPLVKVQNCRGIGANVILHGDTFDDAREHAFSLRDKNGYIYVHGFDDPEIINGAGTAGLEILEDVPNVDAIIVPVGGGGLIAGIGAAVKALKPACQVIGVESHAAPTLFESMKQGRVTRIATKPTLADGLAIAEVGKLPFEVIRQTMDELVMVDEQQIALAILRLLELEKSVVEGAGATSLAAAMDEKVKARLAGRNVVLMLCGGNIDVTTLSRIIERGLAMDGRLVRMRVIISDRPGGLASLTSVLASAGASIKDIHHDRSFGIADVARVTTWVILETRDREHIAEIQQALNKAGFEFAAG